MMTASNATNGASARGMLNVLSDPFTFTSTEHVHSMLSFFNDRRERGQFCDIVLAVGDQDFHAHKVVLAACSPYFNAMFADHHAESRQRKVTLNGIDWPTLDLLLRFMYTASVDISEANVQNLLSGANLLQLLPVVEACCQFLSARLDPENCLGIALFAEAHGCTGLRDTSWRYAVDRFREVALTEEFLTIPTSCLADLLKSEDLRVRSEEEVLDSVLNWVMHDFENREHCISSLLRQVKLPLIPWESLSSKLLSNESIAADPGCSQLLLNAKNYQLHPASIEKYADTPEYVQYTARKSIAHNEFIYVVGGETDPGRSLISSVAVFQPSKNAWRDLAPMVTSRRGVGLSLLGGFLYAVGGSDRIQALRLAERYDPNANEWTKIAEMNENRSSVAAVTLHNHIYAVGGYDGTANCLRTVERYDPVANTWSYVAEMNVTRSMLSVGALGGCLYAIGGYDGSSDLSSCERYDSIDNVWTMVSPMNSRRCMAGVGVLAGMVYAVGGCDCAQSLNSMEVYDPEKDQWTLLSEMSRLRSGVGVAVVSNKLYALGGYCGETYPTSVECYDPETARWTVVSEMKIGRRRFGCCS
eukprot:Em0004g47a